jgi:GTP cyclohydrolase IA
MTSQIIKDMIQENLMDGYEKLDLYNSETIAKLSEHYHEVIKATGRRPWPRRIVKNTRTGCQSHAVSHTRLRLKSRRDHTFGHVPRRLQGNGYRKGHRSVFDVRAPHVAIFWQSACCLHPNEHIVGISKIPRVVDAYARRLQVQERLTREIKDAFARTLKPLGVAVVIEAQHMCMSMRGIQKQNSVTTTSDFSGAFTADKTRAEFVHLIGSRLH